MVILLIRNMKLWELESRIRSSSIQLRCDAKKLQVHALEPLLSSERYELACNASGAALIGESVAKAHWGSDLRTLRPLHILGVANIVFFFFFFSDAVRNRIFRLEQNLPRIVGWNLCLMLKRLDEICDVWLHSGENLTSLVSSNSYKVHLTWTIFVCSYFNAFGFGCITMWFQFFGIIIISYNYNKLIYISMKVYIWYFFFIIFLS